MAADDPEDLRKASDYYRQEYAAISTRLIQVQRELRGARRDLRRQRTLALVIRRLSAALHPDRSDLAAGGGFGDALVAILVESLQIDCVALLRWTATGRIEVAHSLGLNAGFQVPAAGQMPPRALHQAPQSLPEPVIAALRAEGLAQWLWVGDPKVGLGLLLGHRHVSPVDTALAFDLDDQTIAEAVLEVYLRLLEQRLAEERLRNSEERFRRLFEDTYQATLLLEEGRFIAANQAALKMLRVARPDQLVGLTPAELSPAVQPDGRPSAGKAADLLRQAIGQGSLVFEWEHLRADGESFPAQILITVIRQQDKNLFHIVWNDITEQKQARARIEYLAYHDPLTGLANRLLGQDRLQQAVAIASRYDHRLAVLYLDLDKFKYVNDTYGHCVGDLLLKGVAERLTGHLRAADTLCRLSADEFMVVLPQTHARSPVSAVVAVCQRILESVSKPFDLDGRQIFITFTIGVAVYPQDGHDGETLMRHADTALFEAKKTGQHSYRLFEPQMNARLVQFVQTRDALRLTLEREELELYYQPQVDLHTRQVVGVESLLRWRHPRVGLTMPGYFIEVAEESGLIVPIGRWVLREACRQAVRWRAAGWPHLSMGVNPSAVQFRHNQIRQDVLAAVADTGLDPTGLDLELTESILLQDEAMVLATVAEWKRRGIRLSLDDFGTGYSSLAYLKRFKVDRLKIDRSFIVNLLTDDEDRAIVQAMIQVARSLNLRTIAEGVEDAALAEQLQHMGCDEVQGYLYSQPLLAAEMEAWLRGMTPRMGD